MDANVGRVLDALKRAGLEENTLVVFIGDHGYLLGQHGRFEKHCMFEEAVRAALLVRHPARVKAGTTTEALVEFVDLAPTLLEFCGLPVPPEMQGRSLGKVLRGETTTHRPHVIAEYSENEEAMIRTDRWKLMYGTGKRERQDGYGAAKPLPGRTVRLYECAKDPGEFVNLAAAAEHQERVGQMTKELAEHMRRTSREPDLLPRTHDVHQLLEFCLQPRDVKKE